MYPTDLDLDMSAMSVSSNSVLSAARVGGKQENEEVDSRQPSVDGLHSPSSPGVHLAAKHGK